MKRSNTDEMKFLEELILTPSPSGFEFNAQRLLAKRMRPYVDSVESDVTGNLIAVRNPDGRPRVMLAGHCDEVGLMVKYVSDEGFVFVSAIGCPALPGIVGQLVDIAAAKGRVSGVVMTKRPEPNDKIEYKIHDFWVDIGAKNKEDALSLVASGDPVTLKTGFCALRNGLVAGRAFDDRIGAFIIAEVLRRIKDEKIDAGVYGVSTVQEEVGSRGAKPCAYGIEPDIGVAIDVTWATDYPECNKKIEGDVALGRGPVLLRGANINPVVGALLEKTAEKNNIPVQVVGYPGPTSTDASMIQVSRGGVAAALVKIPVRYMHYPVEVISMDDVGHAIELLAAFVAGLEPDIKLNPDY